MLAINEIVSLAAGITCAVHGHAEQAVSVAIAPVVTMKLEVAGVL